MADIPNPTGDITIFGADGVYPAEVTSLNELKTLSPQELAELVALKNLIGNPTSATAPDLWQYYTYLGQSFQYNTTFNTISGSSETDYVLFRNPVGSGKIIRIHDLDYTYNKGAGISIFRVYINPTVTSVGTPITINKKRVGSTVAPIALAYLTPTISARGINYRSFGQSAVSTFELECHLSFILPAGTDLLVTIQPAANNTDHAVFSDWSEVVP